MPETIDGRVPHAIGPGRLQSVRKRVDCNEVPLGSGDKLILFDLPNGMFIDHVKVRRITAEGAAGTVDIGVYDTENSAVDADGFIDGLDVNATGYANSRPGALAQATPDIDAPAYRNGYQVVAPGRLELLANAALDAAVFDVEMFYIL